MKIYENSKDFDYLEDVFELKNLKSEVNNEKLVLSLSPQEFFLGSINSYTTQVGVNDANRGANLPTGNETFVRLYFKGRFKIFPNGSSEGKTTVVLNTIAQTPPRFKAFVYRLENNTLVKIADTVNNTNRKKSINRVYNSGIVSSEPVILDGYSYDYYASVLPDGGEIACVGKSCTVSNQVVPNLSFSFRSSISSSENAMSFNYNNRTNVTQTYSIEFFTEEY